MAFPAPRQLVKTNADSPSTHAHAAKPLGTVCPNPGDVALGLNHTLKIKFSKMFSLVVVVFVQAVVVFYGTCMSMHGKPTIVRRSFGLRTRLMLLEVEL